MGSNILAGAALVAGTAPGQLNQYYGLADTAQTTVAVASLTNLSSAYQIPAGEPVAGSAYELDFGGTMFWGTASEHLQLAGYLNSNQIHTTVTINDTVFGTGSTQVYTGTMIVVCEDGVSQWQGSWKWQANQVANNIVPGTTADNTVPAADSSAAAIIAPVSAAITVVFKAAWTGTAGAPTIVNDWTTFRKIS